MRDERNTWLQAGWEHLKYFVCVLEGRGESLSSPIGGLVYLKQLESSLKDHCLHQKEVGDLEPSHDPQSTHRLFFSQYTTLFLHSILAIQSEPSTQCHCPLDDNGQHAPVSHNNEKQSREKMSVSGLSTVKRDLSRQ